MACCLRLRSMVKARIQGREVCPVPLGKHVSRSHSYDRSISQGKQRSRRSIAHRASVDLIDQISMPQPCMTKGRLHAARSWSLASISEPHTAWPFKLSPSCVVVPWAGPPPLDRASDKIRSTVLSVAEMIMVTMALSRAAMLPAFLRYD